MVNLDTVGRLGKNKLLIIGAGSAKEWMHILRGAGATAGVEVEFASEDLDSSDQKSFHETGAPAVQLFAGPHADYHRPSDTGDKIDLQGMVKTAAVAREIVAHLAARPGPLTKSIIAAPPDAPKRGRRVSLGTIPDFSFQGQGVRLSGVLPGSPAEAAGMREGDRITSMNGRPVAGLKDLSDVMKTLRPGDRVSVLFERGGKEMQVDAVVQER